MKNLNVSIKIAEGKDVLEGRIGDKYLGSLDYSLLTDYIEMEEGLKNIIKVENGARYSDDIICVDFNYSINNEITEEDTLKINAVKKYIKNCINIKEKEIRDKIKKEKDKLKKSAYTTYLKNYKYITKSNNNKYIKEIKREYIKSTAELREELYKNGFTIGDKHYVRLFRSSGSARVGKCLFVNEEYYDSLIKWIYAGIDVEGQEIDLAGFESYISLVASGSIGRFKLNTNNILLIEDYYSKFTNTEDTMVTRLIGEELETTREKLKITNNIFDGQSLLDSSIFDKTEILRKTVSLKDKATLQIRNKFYKGQGVRTDLQQFYKDYCREKGEDYNIFTVEDMFGNKMLVKDILMVTTPSSLKYLKYFKDKKEGYKKWQSIANEEWAICKYDKETHHFNGMTQTHYQLLNSLGMSKEAMQDLLKDTIDYINLLKTDNNVFKYNVNVKSELDEEFTINSNDKMIKALLTWNDDFTKTKVCWDYRKEIINSYIENVRKGHILVEGNYSIVANNVVEMLYASVGALIQGEDRLEIKDKPNLKLTGYEAISNKFDNVEDIAAVRSPQPSMANVGVFNNRKCPNNKYYKELKKYFNVESKEIIFTNSINCNTMEKFSSMDFDIDAVLITNNTIIVEHAKKIQHFAVNNDLTPKKPILLKRTAKNLSVTDINCSKSKIGEVINLVQALNSVYWHSIYKGAKHEDLEELYKDICQLNSLSCIEIDKCKKTSTVNTAKELKKIKEKGYFKQGTKPKFMKYCNEYEVIKGQTVKKPTYIKYEAGMDYLEEILTEKIVNLDNIEYIKLSSIIHINRKEANRGTVNKVIDLINKYFNSIYEVYKDNSISKKDKDLKVNEIEHLCAEDEAIINKLQSRAVIKAIIKRCEKYQKYAKEIRRIKRSLEREKDLDKSRELIEELDKYNKLIAKVEKFKSFRRILKIIFLIDKSILLDCFKNKCSENAKKPYVLYGHKKFI